MTKDMTLKEACERAVAYPKDRVQKVIDKVKVEPMGDPKILYEYTRSGQAKAVLYCPLCGHIEEVVNPSWLFYAVTTCPNCGNESKAMLWNGYGMRTYAGRDGMTVYKGGGETVMTVIDADVEKGYALLAESVEENEYVPEGGGTGEFGFLKGSWKPTAGTLVQRYAFVRGKGFRRICNGDVTKFTKAGTPHGDFSGTMRNALLAGDPDKISALISIASDVSGKECDRDDALSALAEYSDRTIRESAEKRKRAEKRRPTFEALKEYAPDPPTEEEADRASGNAEVTVARIMDSYPDRYRFRVHCGYCGSLYDAYDRDSYFIKVKCPKCGRVKSVSPNTAPNGEEAAKFSVMPDGTLCESVYRLGDMINDDGGFERRTEEVRRICYTAKKPVILQKTDSGWADGGWVSYRGAPALMQDRDEVSDLIGRSVMARSGLAEAWGLSGGAGIEDPGSYGKNDYAFQWYKKKYLEKTVKLGLANVTRDLMRRDPSAVADPDADSATKLLGVEKPLLKLARQKNLSLDGLYECRALYGMDRTLTADEYDEARKIAMPGEFRELKDSYGISPKRTLEYLDAAYDRQCIEKREAFEIWKDYLHMADLMHYDLKEKGRKFPESLKKEHDRAAFAYRRCRNEISREQFAIQYERNRIYEFSDGEFMIKIPKTADEIVGEAEQQNNCVASYVDRVCRGKTTVAFLRRKEDPDKSYVTMEIRDGRITQLRAFANGCVRDGDTLKFVRKFAEKNNLLEDFR